MKSIFIYLFICFLFIININKSFAQTANVHDSLVLVTFYDSTNKAGGYTGTNWLQGPVNSWAGVTLDSNGYVISIVLTFWRLSGSIPSSLGSLSNLQELFLDNTGLQGSIPSSLGNLSNLQSLNLAGNRLSGSIPSEFGNLSNLQNLILYFDNLTGSIPSSLGNLSNLQKLKLADNQLSDSIPSSLGNLYNIDTLFIGGNQLSGSIPFTFGNLSKLLVLQLNFNQLSGSIPSSLGKLSSLQSLYLENNQPSGSIPASLGNLSSLQSLYLENNQLTDSIPSQLESLSNLHYLYLNNNLLSGSIPSELGSLTKLQGLELSYNQLSGPVPSNALDYGIYDLISLGLDNNQLTFSGLEGLTLGPFTNLTYAPQANIPVHRHNDALSVSAGGTLSNNTYYWYNRAGNLVNVIEGDSTFFPPVPDGYYVKVVNAIAVDLVLASDTLESEVLPLQLLTFTGSLVNNSVLLKWVTANEINTSAYVIERSTDGIRFTDIGNVNAANTGAGNNNYSFKDQSLSSVGALSVYYRLREIDKDYKQTLSNVVAVTLDNRKRIIVYPNPAKNVIHLLFNQSLTGNNYIELYDAEGVKVMNKKLTNELNQQISLPPISKGNYKIILWSNGKVMYQQSLIIAM